MAKIQEDPEDEGTQEKVPEQREREHNADDDLENVNKRSQIETAPTVRVIGYMDSQVAVRLGWRQGMVAVSQSRFKFMRDELQMDVQDEPKDYLF
jgi:hypothetical protein